MNVRIAVGIIFIGSAPFPLPAQTITYDDVAVIVNSNSAGSVQIGNYFMAARNIPANRLITIDAPVTTSITQTQFEPLRAAIEEHLIQNELVDSINYIVTTMGVPVRLDNGTCDTLYQFSKCSSFDTDIALILGPYSTSIAANGYIANPYYNSTQHHTKSATGLYLVTRLAGPSVEAVLDLIDRSGPGLVVDPTDALMVADMNNPDTSAGVQAFWNAMVEFVVEPAADLGLDVVIDSTDQFLDGFDNVIGYTSLTSFTEPWLPNFTWAPGAIAVEWYSYSALHYDTPGIQPGFDRLSDWIGLGATAAVGTVNFTYASPWNATHITFDRYLDTSYHFNAAESMYVGISWLSWIYEAIGDPKTSFTWDQFADMPPVNLSEEELIVFPNPSDGQFMMRMPVGRLRNLRILDGLGREVPADTRMFEGGVDIDLRDAAAGLYTVKATTSAGSEVVGRIVLQP